MPSAEFPVTPLVKTFRNPPTGRDAQSERLEQLKKFVAKPAPLVRQFTESVEAVEKQFNCSQPFYPSARTFGSKPDGTPHGERLTATVDVAKRLSKRSRWVVDGDRSQLLGGRERERLAVPGARLAEHPAEVGHHEIGVRPRAVHGADRLHHILEHRGAPQQRPSSLRPAVP